jgi:hyperosmotically inducible protein
MNTSAKFISLVLAFGCASALAEVQPAQSATTPAATQGQSGPDTDNTEINERDKNDTTATPEDQTNAAGDRHLLANVRKAVVADDSLSTSAHNVKMMVQGGVVTLRGPVESEKEKDKIEKHAQHVAGVKRVENHLDINTN